MMKILSRIGFLFGAGAALIGAAAMAQDLQPLGFGERLACQERLEDVYWRHRLWPEANPGSKPSLAEVLSSDALSRKVEDALRLTRSLEEMWRWSIDGAQLQAEIDRMAGATLSPELLRELWAALDNDAHLVAECLARPLLAERLARGWYERGRRRDGASFPAWWGTMREAFLPEIEEPSFDYVLPSIQGGTGDTWTPTPSLPPRTNGTAVWTGAEMIFWGGGSFGSGRTQSGSRYDPVTDTWITMSTLGAPTGRFLHTAVWTGTEMIVWGGYTATGDTSTGGRYEPSTDAWSVTSTVGAPVARNQQQAVWTGGEMLIWGGVEGFLFSGGTFPESGGRYQPVSDSWLPTALLGNPTPRALHTALWTGSEMIVWGGCAEHNCGDELATGSRYDPIDDTWTATSLGAGTPSPRRRHSAVWTGSEMIVWGGLTDEGAFTVTGARYLPGGAQPAAHVARILLLFRPAGAGFRLGIGVIVEDASGAGVDAVLVGLEVTRPNGSTRLLETTTDGSGRARASVGAPQAGTYMVCVTSLEKEGWVYDEEANVATCDEITVE